MDTEDKIDVHNSRIRYRNAVQRFSLDKLIRPKNKQLIIQFLNDCEIGKTLKKRQKKMIKERRLNKLLTHLKFVARVIKKDFDQMQMEDMEEFIRGLENDNLSFLNDKGETKKTRYSPATKKDVKIILRKFYKWLLGNCVTEPEIVSWFDTSLPDKEPDSLDEKQIEQIVAFASGIREKALIWTLFESGARVEEFLNIRIRHVIEKESYYTFRIEYPKTFKRTTPIHEEPYRASGISYLKQWLLIHPNKDNMHAPLFPIGYRRTSVILKDTAKRALNRNVTPHLLRHSRATFLAKKKVGRYQMCKLMGWSMSSGMPDRYIDRAGVEEEDAIDAIRRDDFAKSENEKLKLKRKLIALEQKYHEMKAQSESRGKVDDIMTQLMSCKEVQNVMLKKIKELGFEKALMNA